MQKATSNEQKVTSNKQKVTSKEQKVTSNNRIFEINVEFRNMNDFTLTSLLQFSSEKQTFDLNTKILDLIIQFLKDSSRFDKPLKVHY